jgi:hypothetical protein
MTHMCSHYTVRTELQGVEAGKQQISKRLAQLKVSRV